MDKIEKLTEKVTKELASKGIPFSRIVVKDYQTDFNFIEVCVYGFRHPTTIVMTWADIKTAIEKQFTDQGYTVAAVTYKLNDIVGNNGVNYANISPGMRNRIKSLFDYAMEWGADEGQAVSIAARDAFFLTDKQWNNQKVGDNAFATACTVLYMAGKLTGNQEHRNQ